MKRIALPIASLAMCLTLTPADAYELATHGALTEKAYERSILTTNPQLLKSFGIDASKANVFGEAYYDVLGNDIRQRTQNDFEKDKMPNEGRDFLTVKGWLMRGAIREDDAYGEDNPQDDRHPANATLRRPLHHFFDPALNRPLVVPGIGLLDADIHTAPAWAIGTINDDAFAQTNTPEAGRRNHFAVFDAREAMYRALTGRNQRGDTVAPSQIERNRYWATTLRALGDVVHLIQDMAQPQHTRNDQHAGRFPQMLTGHASVYERYIESRATRAAFTLPSGRQFVPTPLIYDGYPVPRFNDYASFFSTRNVPIPLRQGLADYSNRGFFSAGTNISDYANDYPFPERNPNAYAPTQLTLNWVGEPIGGNPDARVTVLQGTVPDALPGGTDATNIPLTTRGVWDQFLEERNFFSIPRYSLNRYNYDAMADLLIPRAVAYSAGMIDYFFRGKIDLEIESDATTEGQYLLKNDGAEAMKGDFTLYYDGVDDKRYPVAGDSNTVTWRDVTVQPNNSIPLKAPKTPTYPKPKSSKAYLLVFNGEMGAEKPANDQAIGAVAAKSELALLWEPWRDALTDNLPWIAGAGTVNGEVGPNSQQIKDGQLVEYVGAGGAGFVYWQATSDDELQPAKFMKLGIACSQNAATSNWNVYGFISIAPSVSGQPDWEHGLTIPFAGGAGASSGFNLMNKKIPVTPTEYVIDLRSLNRFGLNRIGYVSIETIGFDADLTCSIDYVDFSEEPFEKFASTAVFYP